MDEESSLRGAEEVAPGFFMGRQIAPVRGHELAEWFDRPDREISELPDRLIRALPIDSSDTVADIGAGTGYFTFRLSKLVPRGRVLAVDIDPLMLKLIDERREEHGIGNIELVEGSPADPRLPATSVDLALIVDSYHEFTHPAQMLRGILSGLKEGGYLVIVEYRGEDPTIPVDEPHRMTEEQIRREVESTGFEWVETRDFLPMQHVVVFRRPVG
ncbi:MAG: class I SAM-dependent methyltransferase [Rhodothermales bacterium]